MLRSILAIGALALLGLSTPAAAQAPSSGDNQERRLQRLEEQMVDLSAQIGTVESMSRGGSGGGAPAGRLGASASAARQRVHRRARQQHLGCA